MDKDDITETQKTHEKSLNEVKEELSGLSHKLEKCQAKFVQLNQLEEVRRKQEMLLKRQAHDLNNIVIIERTKLEETKRQTEGLVENFIHEINCALEKNKHVFETNEEIAEKKRKRRRVCDASRKKYFELKGEMEALLLYKEYQECVLDEFQRVENCGGLDVGS